MPRESMFVLYCTVKYVLYCTVNLAKRGIIYIGFRSQRHADMTFPVERGCDGY